MPQTRDDRTLAVIDGLIAQRADEPGVAVSVSCGPEIIAWRCVGLANVAHRVPIGSHTRFQIVSVSKTFMAAAVLVLAARGALKLEDDVRRHLPELPAVVSPNGALTIRHLLSMTSGLRDVLDLALRLTSVSAPPGAQYMYANVNAVLLEEIVARTSGLPAEAFRRAALYEPLGLNATGARAHDGIVMPDLAEPYVPDGAHGWSRATNLLGIAADTLTTSLDDLTRWLLVLRSGNVGGVPVTAAMAEPTRLRDGTPVHYGLGLAVRRYRGLTVLCHSGTQPGYKAHIAYVPTRDVGLVILSNREDLRPTELATAVMDVVIGDFPAPHPTRGASRRVQVADFTAERATKLQGIYVDPEAGEWVSLAVEDGVLRGETLGDPVFLYPEPDRVFRHGDDYRAIVPAELRIEMGPGDTDVSGRLVLGGQTLALTRCDPPHYAADALAAFAGSYESREIASRHTVSVRTATLIVEYGLGREKGRTFAMEPIAPDVFLVRPSAPGIAYRHVFRFERDAAGMVTSAVVTMERLKSLRLWRADLPEA